MNNYLPIDLLLTNYPFTEEAKQLYSVLKSLLKYPAITHRGQNHNLEGKLYATGFAIICLNYFVDMFYKKYEIDFNVFVDEVEFDKNLEEISRLVNTLKIQSSNNSEKGVLYDYVYQLSIHYKRKVVNDIKILFPEYNLQLQFFDSLFIMADWPDFEVAEPREMTFLN